MEGIIITLIICLTIIILAKGGKNAKYILEIINKALDDNE